MAAGQGLNQRVLYMVFASEVTFHTSAEECKAIFFFYSGHILQGPKAYSGLNSRFSKKKKNQSILIAHYFPLYTSQVTILLFLLHFVEFQSLYLEQD